MVCGSFGSSDELDQLGHIGTQVAGVEARGIAQDDEVDILWIGDYPATAPRSSALRQVRADDPLRARLPQVDDAAGTPVYVIDPHGFVILRYAPGFDPGHLRTDVAKLIKLI